MILIDALLLLGLVVFGLMVMFGLAKGSGVIKLFLILLFGPILMMIGINQLTVIVQSLPMAPKIVLILVSPLIVMVLLYWFFPKAAWSRRLQNAIYNAYAVVLMAPVRLARWAWQNMIQRIRGAP